MLYRNRRRKPTFLKRLFRSFFAMVILSAFALGISLFIKEISNLSPEKFARLAEPLSSKLGFNPEQAGEVAGEFVQRFSQTGLNQGEAPQLEGGKSSSRDSGASDNVDNSGSFIEIAILADSENDFAHLRQAVNKGVDMSVNRIIHLGDLSDFGDVQSLTEAKSILESSGIEWRVIPGDLDLGETGGLENFTQVFGRNYLSINIGGSNILVFDNSANFTSMDETRFTWFLENVKTADFVLLSQPLYHPTNDRVMGIVDGEEQEDVLNQAKIMLAAVRDSNVNAIFAADQHISSISKDPKKSDLTHYVVGAITQERGIPLPSRFTVLKIFENGSYDVDEVVL